MKQIEALIDQTQEWAKMHKAARRYIEHAACEIRLKALSDALDAVKSTES